MIDVPAIVDALMVGTRGLTDTEIGDLRMIVTMVAELPAWSHRQRVFLAELAAELDGVAVRREIAWQEILTDRAVPPDWVTAVAALPLEDDET